jgi:6-phosphofructokinase 2
MPPEVRPLEVHALFEKISEIPKGSYVVLSGSAPTGVNESFYAQLITTLKEKGVMVLMDADEDVLKRGANAGPYLMKPNIHEFGRLVEKNITDVDEVIENAMSYLDFVEYVVVSMGPRGAVGISRQGVFHMIPPKVKVRNSVGAGDALLAAVVFVMSNGGSFEEALHLGVACGTASTLSLGNSLWAREDVEAIRKDVTVKKF